jgi:acyl-CoA synthetase (AMP-forming)/AMP-acid ligase II
LAGRCGLIAVNRHRELTHRNNYFNGLLCRWALGPHAELQPIGARRAIVGRGRCCGASPISPSRLFEGLERIGLVFSQFYGQTECYPIAVLRKSDHGRDSPELALSRGFPVEGCEVKILDEADQEVAVGEPGEICVRSPYAMAEYWKRPEQTAYRQQRRSPANWRKRQGVVGSYSRPDGASKS